MRDEEVICEVVDVVFYIYIFPGVPRVNHADAF